MSSFFLLIVLEGYKKIRVETADRVSRQAVFMLHLILFAVYALFTFCAYVPEEAETPVTVSYAGDYAAEPVAVSPDANNSPETNNFFLQWLFSFSGILFMVALVVSSLHSVFLFKKFKPQTRERYKLAGKRLGQLLVFSPAMIAVYVIALTSLYESGILGAYPYVDDPMRAYLVGFLFVFFFYFFLFSALYRLQQKKIYRVNWIKTIGFMLLCGFIAVVLGATVFIVALANTNLSH